MTDDEFRGLLAGGERYGVEFKNSRPRTNRGQFSEVARAVLGMANRRDGGTVIIGVRDDGTPEGMTPDHLATWENNDHVRNQLAPFADPYVDFDREIVTIQDGELAGRRFVVLHVKQFDQIPVLCGAEGRDPAGDLILKIGRLYVRSRETEATVEVSTQAQMREVLDLALDRGIRAWLARNQAVGIALQFQPAMDAEAAFQRERENFDE